MFVCRLYLEFYATLNVTALERSVFYFFFWLLKGFTKLIVLFDFRKLQHYCEEFKRDVLQAILWIENIIFNLRFFRDFKFFAFKPVSGINCVMSFDCKWWHYGLNFIQTRFRVCVEICVAWGLVAVDMCCLGTFCSCSMISKGQSL